MTVSLHDKLKEQTPCNPWRAGTQHVYLIEPRSSIEGNLGVYKFGRSSIPIGERLKLYEKGYQFIWAHACDCVRMEPIILKMLKDKFKQRRDYGVEFFETTDVTKMIDNINELLHKQTPWTHTTLHTYDDNPKMSEFELKANVLKSALKKAKGANFSLVENDDILSELVCKALQGSADDIAKVMYHMGKTLFGVQERKWWAWNEKMSLWVQDPTIARVFCKDVVANIFKKSGDRLTSILDKKKDKVEITSTISSLVRRITDRDLSLILDHALDRFKIQEPHFVAKLDSNKDILAFKGEVYEFKTQTIRPVRSDDYVSKSCGYSIRIPEDKDIQADIMEILGGTLEDEDTLDYLLTIIASMLDGHNADKHATMLTGLLGRNGKTNTSCLITNAFGGDRIASGTSYVYCPTASFLTGERPSSSKPSPDLLNLKGKRIVILSEPQKGQHINNSFLKFITENDRIEGRWCHGKESIIFSPQHSVLLLCNKPPTSDAEDNGIWENFNCVDYPYTFVANPDPTKAWEKKRDTTLKNKLSEPCYGEQFMLMLLKRYYPKYRLHGIQPPQKNILKMKTLRLDNDHYSTFINECIEKSNTGKDKVFYRTIVAQYKKWANTEGLGAFMDPKQLKVSLLKEFGEYTTVVVKGERAKGWKHIKLLIHNI